MVKRTIGTLEIAKSMEYQCNIFKWKTMHNYINNEYRSTFLSPKNDALPCNTKKLSKYKQDHWGISIEIVYFSMRL